MKVAVKCMFRDGGVLRAKELESALRHTGNLVVETCTPDPTCRARQARLLDIDSASDVIPPLLDPELTTLKANRMVLRGYQVQVDAASGIVQQFQQGWVVHIDLKKSD